LGEIFILGSFLHTPHVVHSIELKEAVILEFDEAILVGQKQLLCKCFNDTRRDEKILSKVENELPLETISELQKNFHV
ncbi:hypothetical protein PMAYCL1PPCAC_24930, partial [Pristionchus mayeri]